MSTWRKHMDAAFDRGFKAGRDDSQDWLLAIRHIDQEQIKNLRALLTNLWITASNYRAQVEKGLLCDEDIKQLDFALKTCEPK